MENLSRLLCDIKLGPMVVELFMLTQSIGLINYKQFNLRTLVGRNHIVIKQSVFMDRNI